MVLDLELLKIELDQSQKAVLLERFLGFADLDIRVDEFGKKWYTFPVTGLEDKRVRVPTKKIDLAYERLIDRLNEYQI